MLNNVYYRYRYSEEGHYFLVTLAITIYNGGDELILSSDTPIASAGLKDY